MKTAAILLLVLGTLCLTAALGGDNAASPERVRIAVGLRDGSRLVGVGSPTITLETSVGRVAIPVEQVVKMQLAPAATPAAAVATPPAAPASTQPADLSAGLVASYSFEGDVKDASGSGNHGTVRGSVEFVDGVAGKAARFPGFDVPRPVEPMAKAVITDEVKPVLRAERIGQIEVANSKSLQFDTAFSVAFWMRMRTGAGQAEPGLGVNAAHQAVVAKVGDVIGFWVGSTGQDRPRSLTLWADVRSSAEVIVEVPVAKPIVGQWIHVAVTSDKAGARLFHNGVQIGSSDRAVSFASANRQAMLIGAQSIGGYRFPFDGDVDEVRIYNRALTSGEIETLYGRDKAKAEAINAACEKK